MYYEFTECISNVSNIPQAGIINMEEIMNEMTQTQVFQSIFLLPKTSKM